MPVTMPSLTSATRSAAARTAIQSRESVMRSPENEKGPESVEPSGPLELLRFVPAYVDSVAFRPHTAPRSEARGRRALGRQQQAQVNAAITMDFL
jgi:hypothetical protein